MLNFELDKTLDGLTIFLDKEGIDELVRYLEYIKKEKDRMHLTVGNELSEEIIVQDMSIINQVTLRYLDEE